MYDTRRKLVLGFGLAAAVGWASACGDPAAPAYVVGRWDLVSVNGSPLPATVIAGELAIEFVSGFWELEADGDLTGDVIERASWVGSGEWSTDTARYSGSYSVDGDTVRLHGSVSLVIDGTSEGLGGWALLQGDDLIMQGPLKVPDQPDPLVVLVFRK
jgi:hypothetical protein